MRSHLKQQLKLHSRKVMQELLHRRFLVRSKYPTARYINPIILVILLERSFLRSLLGRSREQKTWIRAFNVEVTISITSCLIYFNCGNSRRLVSVRNLQTSLGAKI
jgi:hypothetical protein